MQCKGHWYLALVKTFYGSVLMVPEGLVLFGFFVFFFIYLFVFNGASRPDCKQFLASQEVRVGDHRCCITGFCGKVWSPLSYSRIRKALG